MFAWLRVCRVAGEEAEIPRKAYLSLRNYVRASRHTHVPRYVVNFRGVGTSTVQTWPRTYAYLRDATFRQRDVDASTSASSQAHARALGYEYSTVR